MKSTIYIGASKQAVTEAKIGILDILNSGQDQTTIQVALEVFRAICEVRNVTITDCKFYNELPKKNKNK